MNLKSSLPTRTLFNVFSKVISSITYLILNVVSTRLLGAETYGNTQYIIWFAYTAWTVVNFAIPTTITRYLALNSLDVLQQFIRKPIFYVVSSIIVILTTVITWYVFQEQTLLVLFLFIGIAGSFLVQSIFEGAFLNRQHFLTTCFSSAITLILFFPLVYHFGLTGYIVSTAILLTGYTVAGGLLINKYLQTYTPKKEISGATEKEIIRFALYTWLAAIVSIFVWQRMEIFFIKLYLTSVEVGYFTIGFIIANFFIQLSGVIVSSLLPYFAQVKNDEYEISENIFIQNLKIIAWFTMLSSWFIAMNSEWIVRTVFGQEYSGASEIVSIMAATIPIPTIATVGSVLIRGRGKSKFLFISNLVGAMLSVVIYVVSLQYWQLVGLVYARFFLLMLLLVIETTFIHYKLKYSYPLKDVLLLFFTALSVTYGIHSYIVVDSVVSFCLSGFLTLSFYTLITLMLKIFSYRDILNLFHSEK